MEDDMTYISDDSKDYQVPLRGDSNDPCKFHLFMQQFGVEFKCSKCIVDKKYCPLSSEQEELSKQTNELFDYLLQYIYLNQHGAVLYTGASEYEKEGLGS